MDRIAAWRQRVGCVEMVDERQHRGVDARGRCQTPSSTPGQHIDKEQLPDTVGGQTTQCARIPGLFDRENHAKCIGVDRLARAEAVLQDLTVKFSPPMAEVGGVAVSLIAFGTNAIRRDEPQRVRWWVDLKSGHVCTLPGGCDTLEAMLDTAVRTLASGANFAALTTLMPDGQPQTHVMWVDCDDEHILINTEVHRRKFKNVEADPRVTVAIWDAGNPYSFVEVRGRVVETVRGAAALASINALSHKYRGSDYAPEIQSERVILRIAPDRQISR